MIYYHDLCPRCGSEKACMVFVVLKVEFCSLTCPEWKSTFRQHWYLHGGGAGDSSALQLDLRTLSRVEIRHYSCRVLEGEAVIARGRQRPQNNGVFHRDVPPQVSSHGPHCANVFEVPDVDSNSPRRT